MKQYHKPLPWAAPIDSTPLNRILGQIDSQIVRFYSGTFDYLDRNNAPLLPESGNYHVFIQDGSLRFQSIGGDTGFGLGFSYACIQDKKNSGTNGGTFTTGAPRTRDLNTIQSDNDGIIINLSANQITLAAGVYRIYAFVPAYFVNDHQATLYNITAGEVILYGSAEYAINTLFASHSTVAGRFTLTETSVLEIQHECKLTGLTNGFGRACGWGDEIYTQVEIRKLE